MWTLGAVLVGWVAVASGQDGAAPPEEPEKAAAAAPVDLTDPEIEYDVLDAYCDYLSADELAALADAWQATIRVREEELVRASLAATTTSEHEALAQLTEQRDLLRTRARRILEEWAQKGGDTAAHEAYLSGLSGSLPTNLTRLVAVAKNWVLSPVGGVRLLLNLVKFLAIFFAFKFLAALLGRLMRSAVSRMRSASELLKDFLATTVRNITFFIGLVVALGVLGVPTGPFLAAIGAAGFVIGFALQGTLNNFAAGVMILLYRPFDVGHVVSVAGVTGKVEAMNLVSTTVSTPDNQTIVVPNGSIWGDVITNVNGRATRRVDLVFGISYGDDIGRAQQVLLDLLSSHPQVLKDPAPAIKVGNLGDSSVNLLCRPWVKTVDYWDVYWDLTRQVKERFDKEGISFPFPQRDVHLHRADSSEPA